MYNYSDYKKSAEYIKSKIKAVPKTAVVLGSGLGIMADELEDTVEILYKDIPNFPLSTAPSHAGKMVINKDIIALCGRFHFYEGYSMEQITYYVRVLKLIGVETLILTNAAGGINKDFSEGCLMVIKDHIKFFDDNPLRGQNIGEFGVRFPDMTLCYNKDLIALAKKSAEEIGFNLREGVYAFMPGPNYETPAEINALRILGADAVGMSTVPEVITARHADMKILAISCITNMAAGITGNKLTEEEVIQNAKRVMGDFIALIKSITDTLSKEGK